MAEGLTEEYIEEQVQKSKYPDEVRRSIRRFYEGLNEPVAPVIGPARKSMGFAPWANQDKIVEKLKGRGLDAVKNSDERAKDANVFVVTKYEIHAPFLPPEEALKANIVMIEAATELGGKVCCSNPHARESFVEARHVDKHEDISNLSELHPEKAKEAVRDFYHEFSADTKDSMKNFQILLKGMKEETKQRVANDFKEKVAVFGGVNACTFEQRNMVASEIMKRHETEILTEPVTFEIYQKSMMHEAWKKGISPDVLDEDNKKALAEGRPPVHVFHGGQQGTKPYANLGTHANIDFQFGAVACEGFKMIEGVHKDGAVGYAFGQSSHNKKQYTPENAYKYGFVYQYKSRGEKQEIFFIEHAGQYSGGKFDAHYYKISTDETMILPHQNKLEKMYLAVQMVNPETKFLEDRLFELEMDDKGQIKDKKWRDFAELHDPINDNLQGYMVDRRNNMIKQYDELGKEAIMQRKLDIKSIEQEVKPIQAAENVKVVQTIETALSNDDRLAALSGRPAPSQKVDTAEKEVPVAPKVKEKPSLKNMFQKAVDGVKEKFEKPKEKTAEEKAKDKKAYKVIQTLRGILQPKKSKKIPENVQVLTNEQTAALQMLQQKEGGR
ncbi:MAG: hypothetical protein IJ870_00350 [Alphaproteobacteria bacterium]|nr:hypothetical protein [Alphaproteobacteria bacterium]